MSDVFGSEILNLLTQGADNVFESRSEIKAKHDKIEEVRDALSGLVAPTRKEPGCITYELLQNREDSTDFTFVEEWESDAALASHAASNHIRATRAKLSEIVEKAPDIQTYTLVG